MAGGVGAVGGSSGGLGSIGAPGGEAGAASLSVAASTPTDFSAQSQPDAGAASVASSNAQVATGFDASSIANDVGSNMAMLGASGPAEPNGGASEISRKPDEEPPAMQPNDDVLAQVVAAYSANQM